jgi:hypothetical protein
MKRLFVILLSVSVLSGCATYRSLRGEGVQARPVPAAAPVAQAPGPAMSDDGMPQIERVPFRAGVSTVTVENMAKKEGCWGMQGAGLMTPAGPVEVYRLVCDNGAVYMAKCELRQCKRMAVKARP